VRVFRLCRANRPAYNGKGAELYGGRWNSKGTRVVYMSESRALAVISRPRYPTNTSSASLTFLRTLRFPHYPRINFLPDGKPRYRRSKRLPGRSETNGYEAASLP